MMKKVVSISSIFLLFFAIGCAPSKPTKVVVNDLLWKARSNGLILKVRINRRYCVRGQTIRLTITAINTSKKDVHIPADTGALVYAKLWRHTATGWELVKRYPQSMVMVASPWILKAGQSRKFVLNLPVESDWPTEEPLRLTVELNGRPDLVAKGLIKVFADKAEYEEYMGKSSSGRQ